MSVQQDARIQIVLPQHRWESVTLSFSNTLGEETERVMKCTKKVFAAELGKEKEIDLAKLSSKIYRKK